MEKMNSIPNESISDLADGYGSDDAYTGAMNELLSNRRAMQTWHAYHVIGDVLRSPELAPASSDLAFLARLEHRLASEPARPVVTKDDGPVRDIVHVTSANASVFRWKMLAGLASVALVGVLGMNLSPQLQQVDAQVARQNSVVPSTAATLVVTDTSAGTMLRDARLDELMAAHRQLGGHSALQVPAGFLRSATHEGPAR